MVVPFTSKHKNKGAGGLVKEIDRLKSENKELREALTDLIICAKKENLEFSDQMDFSIEQAQEALKKGQE